MKNFIKILIFSLFAINTFAQQATEIDSKSVKLPRYANLATIESAIPIPQRQQGMMVYNIETASNWYYNGTAWKDMAVSSVSVPSPLSLTSSSTTITGETNQADEAGVMGINTTDGVSVGVLGRAANTEPLDGGAAVKGENMSTNGIGYGVMGTHNGTGWAGYFEGYNALKTQGNTYLNGDVGIGTDSPFGKLTINTQGVGWNFPSLLLIDDATDNTGGAILQFRNPADKRMDLQSHFGTQSDGTDSYMTFSHNAFYNMRLRGDGNLGIGSLNPNLAGLVVNKKVGNSHAIFGDNTSGVSIESNFPGIHFNSYFNGSRKTLSTGYTAGAEMNPTTGDFSIYTSPASTTGGTTASVYERLKISKEGTVGVSNVLELGYGQTKQIDNGKIALNGFGEGNTLSLVGGGIAADGSDRRIKFFANGESDFTGPIKFNGPLKPAGNTGTLGQVLTSSGSTTAPTWETTAPAPFSNNTRFFVEFSGTGTAVYGACNFTNTVYNTNSNNITIGPNSITFNKAGLYHFDVQVKSRAGWTGCGTCYFPILSLYLESTSLTYPILLDQVLQQGHDNRTSYFWFLNDIKNFDIYIAAPTTFNLNYSFLSGAASIDGTQYTSGRFSGHLISE